MKGSKYTRPAWLKEQGEGSTKPAPFAIRREARGNPARNRQAPVGLGKYTDLYIFAHAHPDRFYQIGTSEQPLISGAASMARKGFIPWAKIACALPGARPATGDSTQRGSGPDASQRCPLLISAVLLLRPAMRAPTR